VSTEYRTTPLFAKAAPRITALEQLRELQSAPSVQMQDTPRESLGHHLGFEKERRGSRNELDERLAQHARFVYHLQESDSASSVTSDDESWDSDESASSNRRPTRGSSRLRNSNADRKRMSIMNNHYYDIPANEEGFEHYDIGALGKTGKRRFFYNQARWDDGYQEIILGQPKSYGGGVLADLMQKGGKDTDTAEVDEMDDDWDDMPVDP